MRERSRSSDGLWSCVRGTARQPPPGCARPRTARESPTQPTASRCPVRCATRPVEPLSSVLKVVRSSDCCMSWKAADRTQCTGASQHAQATLHGMLLLTLNNLTKQHDVCFCATCTVSSSDHYIAPTSMCLEVISHILYVALRCTCNQCFSRVTQREMSPEDVRHVVPDVLTDQMTFEQRSVDMLT